MQEFDRKTIESGIPSLKLMERAGKKIYKSIVKFSTDAELASSAIVCGPGNNAGDGLVLARLLLENSYTPLIFLVESSRYSKEFRVNLKKLEKFKVDIFVFSQNKINLDYPFLKHVSELSIAKIKKVKLVIDAILGNGQLEKPRANIEKLISFTNTKLPSSAKKIAVDLPTGMHANTGRVFDSHIKADFTICIQCIKKGMLQEPARSICGVIKVINIGIEVLDTEYSVKKLDDYQNVLKREPDANKGDFGHLAVIGGSKNMPGAPILSAMAALKTGAGKVTVINTTENQISIYPELMFFKSCKATKNYFDETCVKSLKNFLKGISSCVIGPGLGVNQKTASFLEGLLNASLNLPKVIDADALNIIAEYDLVNSELLKDSVLTPHPKEMSRLLNVSVKDVQNNRYQAAKDLSLKTKACVVLKGAGTIIYYNGEGVVNPTRNPFLATAGSGDVLAGFIASFISQGLDLFNASVLGTLVHSETANYLVQKKVPIIASDLYNHHHQVTRKLFGC